MVIGVIKAKIGKTGERGNWVNRGNWGNRDNRGSRGEGAIEVAETVVVVH